MKSLLKLTALLTLTVAGFSSCTVSTTYAPGSYYNCYPVYDYWGYAGEECYWEYYNEGNLVKELDMVAEVADVEALKLEKMTEHYASKFDLLSEQAQKIAKNVLDLSALSDRSEEDMADFAQKLYGVDPSEIISAVSASQVGNNAGLNSLIESAASNFNTTPATMKAIVKELHGAALKENGIDL